MRATRSSDFAPRTTDFAARAALSVVYEAIREPTPVMISAGENSEYAGGTMRAALDHANYGGLPVAFRAMLDASALKPGER